MDNLWMVFIILFTVQACSGGVGRGVLLPFLPTDEGVHVTDKISRRLGLDGTAPAATTARRPRNVVNLLALLWPQVVGPIDNGIIKEESFDAVPKTPLEHTLDQLRERSKQEVANRQHIRQLLNEGVEPARIGLHQLHLLHTDITSFFPHPQLHEMHLHPDIHDTRPLENHPALVLFNQNMPPPPYSFAPSLPFPGDHVIFQSAIPHAPLHQVIPVHPLIPHDAFHALLNQGLPSLPQREHPPPSAQPPSNHAAELKILGLPEIQKEGKQKNSSSQAAPVARDVQALKVSTEPPQVQQEFKSYPANFGNRKMMEIELVPVPALEHRKESNFEDFGGDLPRFMK